MDQGPADRLHPREAQGLGAGRGSSGPGTAPAAKRILAARGSSREAEKGYSAKRTRKAAERASRSTSKNFPPERDEWPEGTPPGAATSTAAEGGGAAGEAREGRARRRAVGARTSGDRTARGGHEKDRSGVRRQQVRDGARRAGVLRVCGTNGAWAGWSGAKRCVPCESTSKPSTWPNAPPSASGASSASDGGADETRSHGAKVYASGLFGLFRRASSPR